MTLPSGITDDGMCRCADHAEPHQHSADGTIIHTCHPDGECFCVYEALAQPTAESVEVERLRRIIGDLYAARSGGATTLRRAIRKAFRETRS